MQITRESTVADVATVAPATVRIFQQHNIDFCCGGKRPIAEACAARGLDVDAVLGELRDATAGDTSERDWTRATLGDLVRHIQARFHEPLRQEMPRLGQMLVKVVSRHGDHHPETREVQELFNELHVDLLHHMQKEDAGLFPAIAALELGAPAGRNVPLWLGEPIDMMEAEHDDAGRILARIRDLTHGYAPPEGACPTFRGLYYGLAEFEREMHLHVHLENHILFPRALALARTR